MIACIGDDRFGVRHPVEHARIVGKLAENDVVMPVAQGARQRHVFFKNYKGTVGALEFFEQRFDGWAIAVKKHLSGHRWQDVLQTNLELFFEVGEDEQRKNQESEK